MGFNSGFKGLNSTLHCPHPIPLIKGETIKSACWTIIDGRKPLVSAVCFLFVLWMKWVIIYSSHRAAHFILLIQHIYFETHRTLLMRAFTSLCGSILIKQVLVLISY